jgi:hypothetical protein
MAGKSDGSNSSLRGANGSRECAPDDRLRDEAIHTCLAESWIASLALAMTGLERALRETHHPPFQDMMGIASLHPSYGLRLDRILATD